MKTKWYGTVLVALSLALGTLTHAAQPITQRGYDAAVTSANLAETALDTTSITPSKFGMVFTLPVDDNVYVQPLYVPNVAIANQGTHNVVYVATMSDTIYAFDADVSGPPLWSINLASLVGAVPVPIANFTFQSNKNIVGNLGVLSTPVIDTATGLMYVVACTLENNTLAYRLHAIDIRSGAEPLGPGVAISGTYGSATFDPRYVTQRVSLAMSGNNVVFGFAALQNEFAGGYSGWVMGYDKGNLQQTGVFATATNGTLGAGVWQSGRPPAVDSSGYVYVFTGNGYSGGYDGVNNFSESALKLDPSNGMKLVDWFTAGNWTSLDGTDKDLSASGPMLIPGANLLTGGGKSGDMYVLDTTNLGKFNANDTQIPQKTHISAGFIVGGPVYWPRSAANGGPLLYNWGASDWPKAYAFTGTGWAASPTTQGSGSTLWPGGIMTLSANGEQHGSGVIWATTVISGNAWNNPPAPGELHAYNAEDLTQELWNSQMNPTRDSFGNFAKFAPPVVANGKVYVATQSKQLAVYGLLPPFTMVVGPATQTVVAGGSATYTATVTAIAGFTDTVTMSVSGLPAGATGTFSPATLAGSGTSTLTVTTAANTPVGSYTPTITATSATAMQSSSVALTVTSGAAIGIKFVGTATPMGSAEVAGIVPQPRWNNATGTSNAAPLPLVNQTGASSGASVSWNTTGTYMLKIADTAGNNRMMRGYLDTTSGATTVMVSGLPTTSGGYNIYVYADGDNGINTRSATYQISGTGITTATVSLTDAAATNFAGTFTPANNSAGNYVMFAIAPGTTAFTISATPGATTDSYARAPVNAIQIVPQGTATSTFTLSTTPGTRSVVAGSSTTYTTNIAASGGFGGAVSLSVSGLPAGATGTFSPSSVTGSGTSTLTVTTTGSTPVGNSTLTITGTSGAITKTATATLTVTAPAQPTFTLSASPGTQTVVPGSSTTYTTTIAAANGFTDPVTLSVSGLPAGATGTFVPATISGGSGSSTLTVTTTSGTALGSSTLTITGTSSTVTQSATATLSVAGAAAIGIKFVGQGSAMGSTEVAGVVAQSNWNNATGISRSAPLALVNQSGASSGATVTWSTDGIYTLQISDTPGNNRMMRGYLDAITATTVTVASLPATSGGYTVYVYADGDNNGNTRSGAYQISGNGVTTTSVNLIDAAFINFAGTFTQANNSNGNYVAFTIPAAATGFTITATPGTSSDAYKRSPVNAIQIVPLGSATPSFSLSTSPGTQTVTAGNSTTYTTNVTAAGGFSGAVALSVSGLPAGATGTFSPATVTGAGSSTLTVTTSSSTPAGSSAFTITGTSGSLTSTSTATLTVNAVAQPTYTVSATPGTRSVVAGSSTTYTTNIAVSGGFSSAVNLSVSGLPSGATGTFSPATVTGAGSSTLTVTTSSSTPAASSTLTITGTSGATTKTATTTLTVTAPAQPTFTLSASPSTQTVVPGGSTSFTTSITASGGFTDTVTLSVGGLPAGATGTFSPATISGGSGSSTLTVTTTSGTPLGSSTLTITGTSSTVTQSTTATLSVAGAAAIGIKFVGQGSAMGSTEVAGVVAQSNWNDATGANSSAPLALKNQTGASSGASVTWTTDGIYFLQISDTAGNNRMMRGYLDAITSTTVMVSSLPAATNGYTVYVYADGDNVGNTRTGAYQISGNAITTQSVSLTDAAFTNFAGTFVQANNSNGNYVVFSIPAAATGFTITATPGTASDGTPRSPLNAIQIVPQ